MWPFKNSALSISLHHLLSRDKTVLYCVFMQLAPKGWHTETIHAQRNPGSRKAVTYTENQNKLAPKFLKRRALNDTAPFSAKCQQPAPAWCNLKPWTSLGAVPLTSRTLQTPGCKGYPWLFRERGTNGILSMQSTPLHFGAHGHQFWNLLPTSSLSHCI